MQLSVAHSRPCALLLRRIAACVAPPSLHSAAPAARLEEQTRHWHRRMHCRLHQRGARTHLHCSSSSSSSRQQRRVHLLQLLPHGMCAHRRLQPPLRLLFLSALRCIPPCLQKLRHRPPHLLPSLPNCMPGLTPSSWPLPPALSARSCRPLHGALLHKWSSSRRSSGALVWQSSGLCEVAQLRRRPCWDRAERQLLACRAESRPNP